MNDCEQLEDPPRVRVEGGRLLVQAENGSWYQQVLHPIGPMREPPRIPRARSVQNPGSDVGVFQLYHPGRTTHLKGGGFVEDDDVVFQAPDPGRQLWRAWRDAMP